jgi:hypothetical protein
VSSSPGALRTLRSEKSHAMYLKDARDATRTLMGTPEFAKSSKERKKVEMRFAHLKTHHGFERMRLRGLSGARDEFHLAAIVQNLKTLGNYLWGLRKDGKVASGWIWSSRSVAVAITATERRLAQNRLRKSQCAVEIFPTKCGVGVHRPQSST